MARKAELDEERLHELEEENANLNEELERLKRNAEKLLEHNKALRRQQSQMGPQPQMFLLTLGLLIVGRMILYTFVEEFGQGAALEAKIATPLFGAAGSFIFILWIINEYKVSMWLIVPKCLIVVVACVNAVTIFSNGHAWNGTMTSPDGHPWASVTLTIGSLILAASPFCSCFYDYALRFITAPTASIKNLLRSK